MRWEDTESEDVCPFVLPNMRNKVSPWVMSFSIVRSGLRMILEISNGGMPCPEANAETAKMVTKAGERILIIAFIGALCLFAR